MMEVKSIGSFKELSKIFKIKEMGAIIGFVVIFIVFSILSPEFISWGNLLSTFTMAAELGIVAIGITMLMISGEFDLSVGSTFAVVPMVLALSINNKINPFLGFIFGIFLGAFIGYLNGIVTLKTEIPSFITTLGSMMFLRGILLAVTGGFPIMLQEDIPFLKYFGGVCIGGLRYSGIWFIILAIIFAFILERTKFGNWTFATGGNLLASKALGINTNKVKLINFIICSFMAGLAGITTFARFKIIDPTLGQGMELEAIASAVIGGTFLSGGYGSIIGTFLGAFMIGMVRSGLVLAGAPAYWYRAFIGIVLIIAAIINTKIRKKTAG
jgi:simple sugar transport system permease protein